MLYLAHVNRTINILHVWRGIRCIRYFNKNVVFHNMALKLPVISTGFYLAHRGASCCCNLDILDVPFAVVRCKSIPDPNLLKHEWNTKVHNWANSSGREPRDGDLAMFWKRGQSFPACIPWKGIFLSTSKIYLTKVLSQKQRGNVSSLLDPQQLPWFKSQRCSVNEEEWQLCSSGEAADDKRKWMAQGRETRVQRETLPFL